MTWLPSAVNEYGTPVSVLICNHCGDRVTICPELVANELFPTIEQRHAAWGDGCLADRCASYDISRDVDMFFEPMIDHGLIQRSDT